MNLLSIDPSSA